MVNKSRLTLLRVEPNNAIQPWLIHHTAQPSVPYLLHTHLQSTIRRCFQSFVSFQSKDLSDFSI